MKLLTLVAKMRAREAVEAGEGGVHRTKKSVHHGEDGLARRGGVAVTGLALAHTFYSLNAASNGAEIW